MPVQTNSFLKWLSSLAIGLREVCNPTAVCACCGARLSGSEIGVCQTCIASLPSTGFEAWAQNPVKERMDGRVPLVAAFSSFYFHKGESLRKLIHRFKYSGDQLTARDLGREMGRRATTAGIANTFDAIIPVPLHRSRLRHRGYNQSLLLAQGFSDVTGIPVLTDILLRHQSAQTQTRLSAVERYLNVQGDFSLGKNAHSARGKTLLLIDDVFTTGATSEACLETLNKIDGVRLGLATLAYASS